MKLLGIASYGSGLKVRAGRLVLQSQETGEHREWGPAEFPFDTRICDPIGGFVTFLALRWPAERGATLSLLHFDGRPMLTCLPDYPINGSDRIAQLKAHLDPERRLSVAKWIDRG